MLLPSFAVGGNPENPTHAAGVEMSCICLCDNFSACADLGYKLLNRFLFSLGELSFAPARLSVMIRKAFLMSVHPGSEREYERRHNPIWTALKQTLKDHGAHNYSIFLDLDSSKLFCYVEIEDEERWAAVSRTEICQRWWKSMQPLMATDSDCRPISTPLREVFYLL